MDCTVGTFLKNLKAHVVPDIPRDSTMGLKSGTLQVTGPLTQSGFGVNKEGKLSISVLDLEQAPAGDNLERLFRPYPDYGYTIEGEHLVIGAKVVALLVAQVRYPTFKKETQSEPVFFSLLLVCINEAKAEYKRIGLLEHDWTFQYKMTTMTIL